MNLNTKTDFTALMFDILNPLKNKYSKECALLDLGTTAAGYPLAVSQMEAFARPLWGLIPFWSMCPVADVKPFSIGVIIGIIVQKEPELFLGRYNNSVTLYPAGTLNVFPNEMLHKYLKFAYSSRFGFSVPRSNWQFAAAAPDSTLSFEIEERIYTRVKNMGFELLNDKVIIKWSPGLGIEVDTEIIPTKTGHIRKHIVNSPIECIAYDSGFAVDSMYGGNVITYAENGRAIVENTISYCSVRSDNGVAEIIDVAPNTNLISPKTVIPVIKYVIKKGKNELFTEIIENNEENKK